MKPLAPPAINYGSQEWRLIRAALAARIPQLDETNRSIKLTPEETLRVRTEISVIEEMLAWDRPAPPPQSQPSYVRRREASSAGY